MTGAMPRFACLAAAVAVFLGSATVSAAPASRPDAATQPNAEARARMPLDQIMPGLALPAPTTAPDIALPAQAGEMLAEAEKLVEQKRAVGAIVQLETALTFAPRSRAIHLALGRAHMASGNPAKAQLHLVRALGLASDDAATWLLLGIAQHEVGRDPAALKSLLLANLCTPPGADSPVAVLLPYELGRRLDSQGYAAAALPLLEKSLATIDSGKLSDAQKGDPRVADLVERGRPQLAGDIARLKIAAGQAAAVIADLEKLVASGPADRATQMALFGAYQQTGQRDKAIALLRTICAAVKPAEVNTVAAQLAKAVKSDSKNQFQGTGGLVVYNLAEEAVFGTKKAPRKAERADGPLVMVAVACVAKDYPQCEWISGTLSQFTEKVPDADAAVYVQTLTLGCVDLAAVERALKAYPDHVDIRALAEKFFGNVPSAEAAKQVAEVSGSGFAADYVRGRLFAASSQPDKALDSFKKCVEAKKDFAPAYAGWMQAELDAKRFDGALAVRDAAEKADVRDVMIYRLAGRAYRAQSKLRQAVDELRKAEAFDRDNVALVVELADAYVANKQYSEALRRLTRVHEKEPKNLAVLTRLVEVNELEGNPEEAASYAKKIAEIDPANADAGRVHAKSLLARGRLQEAIAELQVLAVQHPQDAKVQTLLGQALVEGGRWQEGLKPLQKALALDETLIDARKLLAGAFASLGRLDDAFEQWKLLAEKGCDDPVILGDLVGELTRRDDLDTAAKWLPKIIVEKERYEFARDLLEKALATRHLELAMKVVTDELAQARDAELRVSWQRWRVELLSITGKRDDAVAEGGKLYEANRANMDVAALYVGTLMRAHKMDQAEKVAEAVAATPTTGPDVTRANEIYSEVLITAKSFDKAVALADRMIARSADPDEKLQWKINRVSAFQSAHRKADAVKAGREIYDEAPATIRNVALYVSVLLYAKDYKTVLAVMDKADADKIATEPTQKDGLDELRMEAQGGVGDFDAVANTRDAMLGRVKNIEAKSDVWYRVSSVYSLFGKLDLALAALERSLVLNPDNASSCNDLGYHLADRGEKLDRAEKLIRLAVSQQPGSNAYLDSLAWLLYKKGRFADAADVLKDVVEDELEPDGVICDHYGDVLYRLGQQDKAIEMWKASVKSREADPDRPVGLDGSTLEKTRAKLKAAEQNRSDVPVAPLGEGVAAPGSQRT